MTSRYDLLISSIEASDRFIVQMFLFALFAVCAYWALAWSPAWLRRPARGTYLALMLAALFFATVYSGGL